MLPGRIAGTIDFQSQKPSLKDHTVRKFTIIWLGQFLSLTGSAMTRFVLAIWIWDQTGRATALVLVGVFAGLAFLLGNIAAGPLIDRFSRKRVIILSDMLVGLTTIALLILALLGGLRAWHIYLSAFFSGIFGTFHYLAFSASITLLVSSEHYTRANSMMSLARYAATIGAPALAGILIAPLGIVGVMLIDILTLIAAVGTILKTHIPQVHDQEARTESGWRSATHGFRYIFSRPPLRSLMLILFVFLLSESFGYPLITPMILARTGGDEVTLGLVQSTLGIGGIIGSAALSLWGGFRRRINGVLLGLILTGLLGDALMGLGRGLPVWLAAAIFIEVFIPLAFSSYDSIWQIKIPPEQQGRVFAARDALVSVGEPVALLLTGLLADHVFEPAMQPGGSLSGLFGGLVGTGPGAGMGLLLVACGIPCAAAGVWGFLNRSVREIESILPDHEGGKTAQQTAR